MDRTELVQHILASKIFRHWHYFTYHFSFLRCGGEHRLVRSIIDSCLDIEPHLPGFARALIDAIAEIGGKEKFESHYEQLLQRLAELLVIRQIVTWKWPQVVRLEWEPTAGESNKNPEISISSEDWTIGVEVKAPSLLNHIRVRSSNVTQVSSRLFTTEQMKRFPGADDGVTKPRDNPLKDFLISADAKFAEFRRENARFFGVLVVVWDDFVYEPISAINHSASGLFTENSFARDENGHPLKFSNVDTVVIIPHLHQIMRATGDQPLENGFAFPLDYGSRNQYPIKVYIHNPHGRTPPNHILECLQAEPQDKIPGSEYHASDMILWFNPRDPTSLGRCSELGQT